MPEGGGVLVGGGLGLSCSWGEKKLPSLWKRGRPPKVKLLQKVKGAERDHRLLEKSRCRETSVNGSGLGLKTTEVVGKKGRNPGDLGKMS